MDTKESLRAQIHRLKRKIEKLCEDNKLLQRELNCRLRHVKNATGARGELYIQSLLKGSCATVRGSAHDLVVAGKRLEIKTSECSCAIKGRENGSVTKRWTWHRPLGTNGQNHYHFLLLVGDIDSRLRRLYRDKDRPVTRYVFFLIPKSRVKELMRKSGQPIIQITTDPRSQRSEAGNNIWKHEKTRKELKKKFRV